MVVAIEKIKAFKNVNSRLLDAIDVAQELCFHKYPQLDQLLNVVGHDCGFFLKQVEGAFCLVELTFHELFHFRKQGSIEMSYLFFDDRLQMSEGHGETTDLNGIRHLGVELVMNPLIMLDELIYQVEIKLKVRSHKPV